MSVNLPTSGEVLPRRILVTGGAGFVGANLVRRLLESGCQVRVLDDFRCGPRWHLEDCAVEICEGDVLDESAVASSVRDQDAVVHLAAQTGVPGSIEDPFFDCRVNVFGTLNLLDHLRQENPEGRFVLASSNAPLGRQPPPATEDKAPLPISPYGASKLAAEAYCLAYHGSWGLDTVALRFANLYGPFSAHKQSVVAKFLNDLERDGRISIYGDGSQTRDFIYVGDLCRAIEAALSRPVGGEIFQIATGVETSIADLARAIEETTGRSIEIDHEQARRGDIDRNYSGVDKAASLLGWSPEVSLREGLGKTHRWFEEYRRRADGSPAS